MGFESAANLHLAHFHIALDKVLAIKKIFHFLLFKRKIKVRHLNIHILVLIQPHASIGYMRSISIFA